MTESTWKTAFDGLGPDRQTQDRLWNELLRQIGTDAAEKPVVRQKRRGRKVFRVLLLAAALAGAMGATAYASGLFGREALQVTNPEQTPQLLVIGEDQKGHHVDNPDQGGFFSITQPQELPEDLDPAIREKVENNKAAWAEWKAWLEENGIRMPAVFDAPEEAQKSDLQQNDDGTWTLEFSRLKKTREELIAWVNEIEALMAKDREKGLAMQREYDAYWEDPANWTVLERRSVTAEEYEQYERFLSMSGRYLEGYDHYYLVKTPEEGKKLEEIAARYGLVLRRDQQVLFGTLRDYYEVHGRPEGMSDEDYERMLQNAPSALSTSELVKALSEACCRGDLFFTEPAYIDHLYWYQDGTFAMDFTWITGSGRLAECYLFNSRYGTMSSGMELSETIEDVEAYSARAYLTRDGAELTLLESSRANAWGWRDKAFLYVYLPDSFLVIKAENPDGLSSEDLEEIADSLRYSVINR